MEEVTNKSQSDSREPLTPEPQDPAPQKKKKKKRAATIGNSAAPASIEDVCLFGGTAEFGLR